MLMRNEMVCCIKKDIKEVIRTKKAVTLLIVELGIALMILAFTLIFSDIPEVMWQQLSAFNIGSLEDVIGSLYPRNVRESTGIFAYYTGFFFSLILVLMTVNILPRERDSGKWLIPLQQGYDKSDLITSKCIVYGLTAGAAVFISYAFYYIAANITMERNFSFANALICAVIHSFNLCFIVIYTMILSVVFKNPVMAAVSMLGTIILVPDIAIYFSFGKLLPTYLLTFVYDSSNSYGDLIIPLTINIMILAVIFILKPGRSD